MLLAVYAQREVLEVGHIATEQLEEGLDLPEPKNGLLCVLRAFHWG